MSFKVKFEKITCPSTARNFTMLIAALVIGTALSSLTFLLKGVNPWLAVKKIFMGAFGSSLGINGTITKAIPLILIGSGLAVAYRGKFWNIGAEGQLLFGATAATWVALSLPATIPGYLAIPLLFISGFVAGAVWCLIPGLLKLKFGINEAISSLMLNYIAAEFVQYLIYGPWKGKSFSGFPVTEDFPDNAVLPYLSSSFFYGSRIHYHTLILALISCVLLYFLITKTKRGYEIRTIGENPRAAQYAGMSFGKTVFIIATISGGLAGMAGVGEVAGIHHHLTYPWAISSGYGFTAIITAFLAGLNPLGVIISSIFFGGILVGGDVIQTSLGLPFATVNIFNGMILFALIAKDYFLENRLIVTQTDQQQGASRNG